MGASPDIVVANDKSGTFGTATAHIACAMVGAGVLGLPNSVAWLGWIAGPICVCIAYAVSLWSSQLLVQLYRVDGMEFARYHHLVEHVLGRKGGIVLATFQITTLVLSDLAYLITGGIAMRSIAELLGTPPHSLWCFVLIMGGIEVFFSQIPSLEDIWWVSVMGTVASLGYVLAALILGLVYSGNGGGSIGGRSASTIEKVMGIFSSLGNILFAFGCSQVLLEIQDTLRQPPSAIPTMRKAAGVACTAAFGFYLSTSVACYAAEGNGVQGEVLEGFDAAPSWVKVFANIMIAIHMITAFQVWAQPVFETVESQVKAVLIKRLQRKAGIALVDDEPLDMIAEEEEGEGEEGEAGARSAKGASRKVGSAAVAGAGAAGAPPPSPFDAPMSMIKGGAAAAAKAAQGALPRMTTGWMTAVGSGPVIVENGGRRFDGGSRTYSRLRSRYQSTRGDGHITVTNSAPIPDILPPGGIAASGWKRGTTFDPMRGTFAPVRGTMKPMRSETIAEDTPIKAGKLETIGTMLGRHTMYRSTTGAANERVPLNEQGFFLPLWQRVAMRTTYVLILTAIACVVPFFSAITGIVGAVSYFPMTLGFPFLMYIKVKQPGALTVKGMKATAAVMLLVACVAVVGSVYGIVISLQDVELFG